MNGTRQGPKLAGGDRPAAAQRNLYFRGKLLTVADYADEQAYQIERRRLINRALHGWGLIAGFAVRVENGALLVSPGLAFDRRGRELVACSETLLERESDIFWLDADGRILEPGSGRSAEKESQWRLSAHYAEKGFDAVRIDDGLGDSLCEANRVFETVVFSLARRGDEPEPEQAPEPDFDPCPTARLARRSGVEVDLQDPVPLALVTVSFDKSGDAAFVRIDPGYRPRLLEPPAWTVASQRTRPGGPRTGGGLTVRHVATPVPASDPADNPAEAARIAELTSENERLVRELEQARSTEREPAATKIGELTQENERLGRELEQARTVEREPAAKKIEELTRENERLGRELEQARTVEREPAAAKIGELTQENERLAARVGELEQARIAGGKQVQRKRQQLVRQLDPHVARRDTLERELDAKVKQHHELVAQLARLTADDSRHPQGRTARLAQRGVLSSRLEQEKVAIDRLVEERNHVDAAIRDLEGQIRGFDRAGAAEVEGEGR